LGVPGYNLEDRLAKNAWGRGTQRGDSYNKREKKVKKESIGSTPGAQVMYLSGSNREELKENVMKGPLKWKDPGQRKSKKGEN